MVADIPWLDNLRRLKQMSCLCRMLAHNEHFRLDWGTEHLHGNAEGRYVKLETLKTLHETEQNLKIALTMFILELE